MKNIPVIAIAVAALCVIVAAQDINKPAGAPDAGKVALRVNKEKITRGEFEDILVRAKGREFMEELVDWLLVKQAASKAGVSVTEEEVEEQHEDMLMRQFGIFDYDINKLRENLEMFGYTISTRKKATAFKTRMLLLARKVIQKERTTEHNLKHEFEKRYPDTAGRIAKVNHIHVSATEMRKGINKRLSYLKYRQQVASDAQKRNIGTEIAQLKEKLEKWKELNSRDVADIVVKKLRAGEDFAKIAGEYGANYTSEFFDMGWTTRDILNKLLVPAVFEQLKPGEIGEPIQSQWGFHVLKLVNIKDVSELKFEEVRPYLKDELSKKLVTEHEIADMLLKLRKEAAIERPGLPLVKKNGGESGK